MIETSSYKECRGAVNKKKKSPGLDGLPSEFYQCLWGIIGFFFFTKLFEIY